MKYFINAYVAKKYIIVYAIYLLCSIGVLIWNLAFFIFMISVGLLASIMYICHGVLDKISFNINGITTYRFISSKTYSWDTVQSISYKENTADIAYYNRIRITIKIKMSENDPYTVISWYTNRTVLDEISKYYGTEKKAS